jgi:hypothetical protein
MSFMSCPDFYPDFFNVQVRSFQKRTRLFEPKTIYILYNARLNFFFEKMLETRNGQTNRRRQITYNELSGNVSFDLPEYLLYSVIHLLAREEPPRL